MCFTQDITPTLIFRAYYGWYYLDRLRDAIEHILRLVIECSSVESLIQQVLISDNFLTALFDRYHDFTDFDGRLYGSFWVNNIRPNCF
jgi:hypothetical protein